ncbi:Protein CBR-CHCH-3 [Caenorhabditis briggsae]|uniref:Protein CBR-CHCH-3 n=1 Tax=Caenorhabditis briggsae TaxID=6238 RepID=A8XHV4_CAEBR|nr:Protein CBR-CHCH-3 [Caenorhabditis briggsae]CAP32220.2 Protein CBR-CHCH-3 [Caenorhabditis briggsae]
MGAAQSTEQEARPEVIRIDRNEIPEETVGVSSDVVKRVNATRVAGNDGESDRLRQELAREREEKARLREDMAKLSQLQQRKSAGIPAPQVVISGDDLEDRKRFSMRPLSVCRSNSSPITEIVRCLQENPGRVLKCAPLTEAFEKCVGEFRQQVLKGN